MTDNDIEVELSRDGDLVGGYYDNEDLGVTLFLGIHRKAFPQLTDEKLMDIVRRATGQAFEWLKDRTELYGKG